MDYQATLLESQLDFLTCSSHSEKGAQELQQIAASLADDEGRLLNKLMPFRLQGYQGWKLGRVRFGMRGHGALLQLSGQLAEDWAKTALSAASTVTRCDLAATVRFDPAWTTYGQKVWSEARAHYTEHPRSAQPWRVENGAGGTTVYLGQRRSPIFFRIYDKWQESISEKDKTAAERYARCWRFELEAHDVAAKAYADLCISSAGRSHLVAGVVHKYLHDHGIDSPINPVSEPVHLGGFRRRSDYATSLAWFRRSVRPRVQWALEKGEIEEVKRALGLEPEQPEN